MVFKPVLNKEITCDICGSSKHPLAKFCKRCKKIIDRVDMRNTPNKNARIKALKTSWDGHCFRCGYSGVQLEDKDYKSPLYVTFDHRLPGEESDIIISAAVINSMKSDLSDKEFKNIINKLARHFQTGESIRKDVFKLKYWRISE